MIHDFTSIHWTTGAPRSSSYRPGLHFYLNQAGVSLTINMEVDFVDKNEGNLRECPACQSGIITQRKQVYENG